MNSSMEKRMFFPVFDGLKLQLYTFIQSPWFDQYIYYIQKKYSYPDTVLLTAEEMVNNKRNRNYDIVNTTSAPSNQIYQAFDVAKVMRYPKLSFVLEEALENRIVQLSGIVNYCKEYFSEDDFMINSTCNDYEKFSKSIDIGPRERNLSNRTIIRDIMHFPVLHFSNFDDFELLCEYNIVNGILTLPIETSVDEYETIQKLYFIGKENKEAIDYIENKYALYWKRDKVKQLKK